jgi:ribosomal protein S18 acetylase RimI-like enzyme
VRAITFATGYMGEPAGWLWSDGESFADVFVKYYTDEEPHSLLVAERAGSVVGYLSGCADSSRKAGFSARQIRRLVRRGAWLRPGMAAFWWRAALDLVRDRRIRDDVLRDPRYPSHLHLNLLPAGRGLGLGRRLLDGWLARLRQHGSPGVHLSTFAENTGALRFFRACGFERHGAPVRAPGFRTRDGARMHVQWMVRSL